MSSMQVRTRPSFCAWVTWTLLVAKDLVSRVRVTLARSGLSRVAGPWKWPRTEYSLCVDGTVLHAAWTATETVHPPYAIGRALPIRIGKAEDSYSSVPHCDTPIWWLIDDAILRFDRTSRNLMVRGVIVLPGSSPLRATQGINAQILWSRSFVSILVNGASISWSCNVVGCRATYLPRYLRTIRTSVLGVSPTLGLLELTGRASRLLTYLLYLVP
jgi:hypothetical protein